MQRNHGSARTEAERLVAMVLAAAGGWATGTPECCVCPLCKVIAGLRDPSPETAERLATGAGDLAAGVAGLLRAFAAVVPGTPTSTQRGEPQPAESRGEPIQRPRTDGDPWAAATMDAPGTYSADDAHIRGQGTATRGRGTASAATAGVVGEHDAGEGVAGEGDDARPDGVV